MAPPINVQDWYGDRHLPDSFRRPCLSRARQRSPYDFSPASSSFLLDQLSGASMHGHSGNFALTTWTGKHILLILVNVAPKILSKMYFDTLPDLRISPGPSLRIYGISCRWQPAWRICANAMAWLTPKTRPSSYVLPRWISSFYVTGRRHK